MSISSKMRSNFVGYLCLIFISVLGAITANYTIFVPFLYTFIYGCAYIFWSEKNSKFPYYFHIALLYLITNNRASGAEAVLDIVKWGLVITAILLLRTFIKLRKKAVPLHSADGIAQSTMYKYKCFCKENPTTVQRTLAHCMIIYAVSCVAYFAYDYNGYWLIISASAVLIASEYGKITMRGRRRIVGSLVSIVVLAGLVFFNANTVVLFATTIISMIGILRFMPSRYILGSACINIHVVSSNILASGDLSYTIVGQRVLWTILGAVLTLMLCYVCDKLLPSLYNDYTKEKLIVAKN